MSGGRDELQPAAMNQFTPDGPLAPHFGKLRDLLSSIRFSDERYRKSRNEVRDTLDSLVDAARAGHVPVEQIIVSLKQLCAAIATPELDRSDREWLVQRVVSASIARYYDDHVDITDSPAGAPGPAVPPPTPRPSTGRDS